MAARITAVFDVLALAILLQLGWAKAQSPYIVGDNNGWTFPPNGVATFYDDWAKKHAFQVGDSLFFDYQYNYHDVMEVSKADFDSCSASNPISTYNQGNSTVTLDRPGYYGFICSFPSHCVGNMKMELTVGGSASPPSPAPAGAPGPVPPESSAHLKYHTVWAMIHATVLAASAFLLHSLGLYY